MPTTTKKISCLRACIYVYRIQTSFVISKMMMELICLPTTELYRNRVFIFDFTSLREIYVLTTCRDEIADKLKVFFIYYRY